MEEYAAIGVDLIDVTPRSDDPASWVANFAPQVVPAAVLTRLAALEVLADKPENGARLILTLLSALNS
jgi:uncharacterized membrane protein